MAGEWAWGYSQTIVVWTWHHYFCEIWSTLGDKRHGGEALSTNKDAYHVQGEVMINMVGCVEPMDDFWWRIDVRICKFFMGIYHAEGRMIPCLGTFIGWSCIWFSYYLQKQIPQVKSSSSFKYYGQHVVNGQRKREGIPVETENNNNNNNKIKIKINK